MKLRLIPQRSDSKLNVSVLLETNTIYINDKYYDLTPLLENVRVHFDMASAYYEDGQIVVELPMPYKQNTSIDVMQIHEIIVEEDGIVSIPEQTYEAPESVTEGIIEWPEIVSIEKRRETKWREVEAYRNNLMQKGGFPILDNSYWLHSDLLSRSQQLGLIELGKKALAAGVLPDQNIPNTPAWRTMSGEYVPLTPQLTESLVGAFLLQEASIFAVGDYWRNQINISDNPESIDLTSETFINSWPATYQNS